MTVEITLTRGYTALIDDDDRELALHKWHSREDATTVYVIRSTPRINGKQQTVLLHRLIMSRMIGRQLGTQEFVDHINRNGLDNRRENLRLATSSENSHNSRKHVDNTSGFKGVTRDNNKWKAQICVNRKVIHLGNFNTPEEAHAAYVEAALKYHGKFARNE